MNKYSLITLLIYAVLTSGIFLNSEWVLAGRSLTQNSLIRKAVKGAFVIGTTATLLLFSSPLPKELSKKQIDPQLQATTQKLDPFRKAVLELNPLLLAQTVRQTNVNRPLFLDGSTALHYAVIDGHFQDERSKLQVVDILMAHGADPYLKNGHGVSVFDKVVNQLQDKQAKIALAAILARHVHGINATDEAGVSSIEYAIKYASESKSLWLAQELVTAGADISVLQDSEYVSDVLKYIAGQHSELKVLEDAAMLLTDADQFLAAIDGAGDRAKIIRRMGDYLFAVATNHDNFAAAEALIKSGINPNDHLYRLQDSSIRIARLEQPATDDVAYFEWLLSVGADPNQNSSTVNGLNMLHLAAWHGDVDAVKLLLANGADPTLSCDLRGRTALHYALTSNSYGEYPVQIFTIVNTLLAHNAATNSGINLAEIRDHGGLRPYEVAIRHIDDSFTPYSFRSHTIINAATAAILRHNMSRDDHQGHTASYWANLSGLERIKNLIKQDDNSYLSGEELDSFGAYLRSQISSWDSL